MHKPRAPDSGLLIFLGSALPPGEEILCLPVSIPPPISLPSPMPHLTSSLTPIVLSAASAGGPQAGASSQPPLDGEARTYPARARSSAGLCCLNSLGNSC